MPSYEGVFDHKNIGCFQLTSNGFLTSKLIVFKKIYISLFVFYLFCIIVTEPFY